MRYSEIFTAERVIYGVENTSENSPARLAAEEAKRNIDTNPVLSKVIDLVLTLRDDLQLEISFIETLRQRRRGHGGAALSIITDAADRYGAILILKASFTAGTGARNVLKQSDLERFYRKRGFVDDGDKRWMKREPRI